MNAGKYTVWINGQPVEVSEAVYMVYTHGENKMRYFEHDLKVERVIRNSDGTIKKIVPSREDSLDRLISDNAEQFQDNAEDVETAVLLRISNEELYRALCLLSETEMELIDALFFRGQTERKLAAHLGVSQPAIHKQKHRILQKLKFLLENMKF